VTRKGGYRFSSFTSYIQPFLTTRKKLKVVSYAQVERILFEGKRAVGVAYTRHGVSLKAYSVKEVIVSAGVFGSSILLFKSGIGPKKLLAKTKIRSIADLPVGKTLAEHHSIFLGPFNVSDPSKLSSVRNNLTRDGMEKYLNHKVEHVLSETGIGPQAFIVSPIAKEKGESAWPDVQLSQLETNFEAVETFSSYYPPNQFGLHVIIGRPESLGTLKLNTKAYRKGSRGAEKLAVIDYSLLRREQDVHSLTAGKSFTASQYFTA